MFEARIVENNIKDEHGLGGSYNDDDSLSYN